MKRLVALFLFVLLSCESFAAIVSDNDGSSFVTKREFEALKENFASQVEKYNASIDSKIDGAIANYLTGSRLSKWETAKLDTAFNWVFPIVCLNNSEWNQKYSKYYSYEMPDLKNIGLMLRNGTDTWEGGAVSASTLDYDSTAALSSDHKSIKKATAFAKQWFVTPVKYSEMIEINDTYVERTISSTTLKCYKLKNVGKGRHVVSKYTMGNGYDSGHLQDSAAYWGYSGIMGVGVSGARGYRSTLTASNFANWTSGTWTRTGGEWPSSQTGWGVERTTPFVLPAATLNLNGALSWANTYTSKTDSYHGKCTIAGVSGGNTKTTIKWENDQTNHRSWIFTGNSDAPATSAYGWYFSMDKPSSATENFEGYIMEYENDLGLAYTNPADETKTWYGFHSWTPHWYWKYTASGSIGTNPSSSQFSKLPAKQIYYIDGDNNTHYLDEGFFLFNITGIPEAAQFTAKWQVLDSSVTSSQKINLRVSSTPFSSDHDNSTDLKYKVDDGTESASQQVSCGSSHKIRVTCDESVKQLYMMWTPVTSGMYIGLSELSDMCILIEQ